MFRFKRILIIGLFSSSLFAQQDVSVPLGNRMYDVFELTPTDSTQQFSVEVNSATALTIDIYTAVDPVIVTIEDPSGTTFPASSINSFTVGATEVVPLGAFLFAEGVHQQALINNPAAGTWLVNVSIPGGTETIGGTMTVVQTGGLQAGTIISRPTYTVGDSVVIAIAAFDSGVPSLGATAEANIYQEGSELTPQTIALFDDGSMPDMQVGDGLYTGQISGLSSGDYLVETVFQSGTARIAAGAQFEVIPPLGVITNNVTDTGIDTNADGLFDRIDIDLEVDISSPGTYDLLVELKLYLKTILKGTQVVLPTGISTQSVSFSAEDIKKYLNGDGPYEISDVRLIRNADANGAQRTRMADRRTDLGSTQPYQLRQLQRPLTLILDGLTESAVDFNGNGKFDVLNVGLRVDVLQTGTYTWSGSVKAPDGTTLATASSSGILNSIGIFNLSLSFDGAAIGAAGLNGPYTISGFGIYGPPNAAALRLEMGQTAGYTASQFEGFAAPPNAVPSANPGGPYTGIDGQLIEFDGSASSDSDGDQLTYAWNFGDGSSASGVNPSHTYALPGTYTATLVVNDRQLNSSPVSTMVTVTPSNFAPTANPGGPYSVVDGQSIMFDGSASSNPYGDPLTYAWNFGDGSSATGVSPSYTYALPGTYTVTLIVNDGLLSSLLASTTVTVVLPNVAPIANAGGPYIGVVGTPIVFDGSTSSGVNGDVLSLSWDFGDGITGSGVSPSHMYTAEGIYTVTLIVNDGVFASESGITTSTVGPGNNVPVADPYGPYFGFINTPITFDGSRSNDLDGDLLAYSWDFGDGTTGTGINPTHSYSNRGFYTVSLVVNDGVSNSFSISTSVSVNNIQIDNDVPATDVGSWRVEVSAGGESRDAWLTAVGTPSETQFNQAEIIYDYFTFVDIGNPGGAIQLSSTVTSGPVVISSGVGVDRVRSSGTFIGENGNSINWSVDSTIDDGSNTMVNSYTFTAQSGEIGRIRLWQYLDEDVLSAGDDVFFTRGTYADLDLEMFTVDDSQSIGLSHSGSLSSGQGLVNSSFTGYAACRYNQMMTAIVSGLQEITPNGELCSTLLERPLSHPVVGAAYGPIDVVSSLAWDVEPTATTATVITTLGGVPTAPPPANSVPSANPNGPYNGFVGEPILLDGSGSSDPDDDALAYSWKFGDGSVGSGISPSHVYTALGTFTVTLTVNDGTFDSIPETTTAMVVNRPPVCSLASPSLVTLWPPNHKFVPISINGVTDPDGDTVAITIVSVTQDEPLNGLADGNTTPDAFNQTVDVLIRAERSGRSNGRVYQINFTADDGNGGNCTGHVNVEVPHSNNGNPVADDGQNYNSL